MPSAKPFLLFPFCPFPFASLSLQGFVRSEISSPFRTSWLGWLGGSHGRLAFTVLHAWGNVDFRLGRRAANSAALLVFISLVFLSDVAFECCRSSCASSFFSSHGFSLKGFLGFVKKGMKI